MTHHSFRLSAKKPTRQTFLQSIRRNILCHLYVNIHHFSSAPQVARNPEQSAYSFLSGSDCRPIRLRHPQTYQTCSWKGHLYLRGRGTTPCRCADERDLRGTQVRRPVHVPPSDLLMAYPRDEDGFLYVSYSGENTFGSERWRDGEMKDTDSCV